MKFVGLLFLAQLACSTTKPSTTVPHAAAAPPPTPRAVAPAPRVDAPAGAEHMVAPRAIEHRRISGTQSIAPSEATKAEIARAGLFTLSGTYKVCISTQGHVSKVEILRPIGMPDYDRTIIDTITREWRYSPFLINGSPTPVCTAVTFNYAQGPKPPFEDLVIQEFAPHAPRHGIREATPPRPLDPTPDELAAMRAAGKRFVVTRVWLCHDDREQAQRAPLIASGYPTYDARLRAELTRIFRAKRLKATEGSCTPIQVTFWLAASAPSAPNI